MTPLATTSAKSAANATTQASSIPSAANEAADIVWPPTDLESDEPPLETTLHLHQLMLLISSLNWLWKDRDDYFAGGNLTVYYSPRKRKDEMFRGPDFFVALDTKPHPRKSWMIWEEEGKYPNVIVELLSDSTAAVDRDLKKKLYAETFRTPEYFWFDPEPKSLEFKGFILTGGSYEPIVPNENGLLWSQQLQLYLGIRDTKLRYFQENGELVPTLEEATNAAEEVAKSAREALSAEQEKSAQLADKLRELGIDPNAI